VDQPIAGSELGLGAIKMLEIFARAALGLCLTMAQAQSAPSYDALIQQGKAQLQAGNSAAALSTGQQAVQLDANRWEAYALAGGALMNLKRYEEAADDLSEAIKHAPEAKQDGLRALRKQCVLAETGATPGPPQLATTAPPQPAASTQAEIVLWKTIELDSKPDDLQAYLKQYPNGAFASLAAARLEKIEWARIQNTFDPAQIDDFLRRFPDGEDSGAAKARLKKLQGPDFTLSYIEQALQNQGEVSETEEITRKNGQGTRSVSVIYSNVHSDSTSCTLAYTLTHRIEEKINGKITKAFNLVNGKAVPSQQPYSELVESDTIDLTVLKNISVISNEEWCRNLPEDRKSALGHTCRYSTISFRVGVENSFPQLLIRDKDTADGVAFILKRGASACPKATK